MSASRARDELEFATNWSRVFSDIYQHLKWLNAYADVNLLAMQKVLKEFQESHFDEKNFKLFEDLTRFVESRQFVRSSELQTALTSVVEFFIVHLTKGNEKKARYILEKQMLELRRGDAIQLAALGAASFVMFLFFIAFTVGPGLSDEPHWTDVIASLIKPVMVTFRISTIVNYIVFATGVCIHVFNTYNINYLFIFECDPYWKMTMY